MTGLITQDVVLLTDFVCLAEVIELLAKGSIAFSKSAQHCSSQELLNIDEID